MANSNDHGDINTHGPQSPGIVYGDYINYGTKQPPSSTLPFILPQHSPALFVGRVAPLKQLASILSQPKNHKITRIVAVVGTGGIGKSAIACYFADQHKANFPDGIIGLRVDNKDVDTIARDFARSAGEPIEEGDTCSAATIMQDIFATKQMLLIIDNAQIASIRDLYPGAKNAPLSSRPVIAGCPDRLIFPRNNLLTCRCCQMKRRENYFRDT